MQVIVRGTPEEIAALVVVVQKQQNFKLYIDQLLEFNATKVKAIISLPENKQIHSTLMKPPVDDKKGSF